MVSGSTVILSVLMSYEPIAGSVSEGQEYNSVHSYIATDNFLFAPHEWGSLMLALIRLTHLSNLCTLIYWLHGVLTQDIPPFSLWVTDGRPLVLNQVSSCRLPPNTKPSLQFNSK